jgi:hypothetical protein
MPNYYQIGDQVRLSANFTDSNSVAADPSSLSIRVIVGSADNEFAYVTDAEVIKSGVGSYYYDIDVASPGQHFVRWRGWGNVRAAEYTTFFVNTPMSPFLGS